MVKLNTNEELALEKLLRQLEEKFPEQIAQIILYGSKARGDSDQDSDVDVLVVLKEEDSQVFWDVLTLASEISLEYDLLLNPIISTPKRVERQRGFAFYKNVARDAIQLSLQQGQLNLLPNPTI